MNKNVKCNNGTFVGMQKDIFGRREDLMMSWAKRLGNGSSKRVR